MPWKKLMIPNIPDCRAILNPHHFRLNVLFSILYHLIPCVPVPTMLQLHKLLSVPPTCHTHPTSGPLHVPLCLPRMPPFPMTYLHDGFIYSQVSVKCHFFVSPICRNPLPVTLFTLTSFIVFNQYSSLCEIILVFVDLESESSYWNVSTTRVGPFCLFNWFLYPYCLK